MPFTSSGFTEAQRIAASSSILKNIVQAAFHFARAAETPPISSSLEPANAEFMAVLELLFHTMLISDGPFDIPDSTWVGIQRLVEDKQVQRVRNMFLCGDNRLESMPTDFTDFFLDQIERVRTIPFVPFGTDLLQLRRPTTDQQTITFSDDVSLAGHELDVTVTDVGGQVCFVRMFATPASINFAFY